LVAPRSRRNCESSARRSCEGRRQVVSRGQFAVIRCGNPVAETQISGGNHGSAVSRDQGRRRSVMTGLSEVGSRSSKFKAFLANASVALVSTVVSYFIVEAIFFRVYFPVTDSSVRPHLPETPGVLTQTTKAGFVPHDYVAILGDSMAEGLGDALLA